MIKRISFLDRRSTNFPPLVDGLIPNTVEFKEGVNVIVGASGSGKSAFLYFLASLLHCTSGTQILNTESISKVQNFGKTIGGFEFDHNGAAAYYYTPELFNPKKGVVTSAQRASFISSLFSSGGGKIVTEQEKRVIVKSYLIGDNSAAEYERVYLMDSIDVGLSAESLFHLINTLGNFASSNARVKPQCQVILATNNPFILAIPGVNIIEFTPQYAFKLAAMYRGLINASASYLDMKI